MRIVCGTGGLGASGGAPTDAAAAGSAATGRGGQQCPACQPAGECTPAVYRRMIPLVLR